MHRFGQHQQRHLAEQAFALAQRFPHQAEFGMFQIAQTSMDDPGGSAGSAGRKIVLLYDQGPLAALGTLPRNGDAVNAAADHQHVKRLVARWERGIHRTFILTLFSKTVTLLSEY